MTRERLRKIAMETALVAFCLAAIATSVDRCERRQELAGMQERIDSLKSQVTQLKLKLDQAKGKVDDAK